MSIDQPDPGNEDDAQLFRKLVGKVKLLTHDLAEVSPPRPAPVPTQRLLDERNVLQEMASGLFDGAELETGDELLFCRPGIQSGVFRKLRRGQFAIEAELDLHGCTVDQAREWLLTFLQDAQVRGNRCVRIVHGKGHGSRGRQPVLKGKVNQWLRQIDAVLAFSSTRPVDGGTGAVYVLLKRASA